MAITSAQREILTRVGANYSSGLSSAEASQRRTTSRDGGNARGLNTVRPPINCPKWVCCLLPCINHISSIKQFRLLQPDDAEVLRDGQWVRYDHASLVVGDIVRLVEGDVIPADCVIISIGMDHVDVSIVVDEEQTSNSSGMSSQGVMDFIVDSHLITGEAKPRQISNKSTGVVNSATLYFGSRVLQGACMAVVTATGDRVMLAKLIKAGRWPPQTDLSEEVEEIDRMECMEAGIALSSMS